MKKSVSIFIALAVLIGCNDKNQQPGVQNLTPVNTGAITSTSPATTIAGATTPSLTTNATGTATGGGSRIDLYHSSTLERAKAELILSIENLDEKAFSDFPEGWNKQRMLKVLKTVKLNLDLPNERDGKPLKFNYKGPIQKEDPLYKDAEYETIWATTYFIQQYDLPRISTQTDLERIQTITNIKLDILREFSHFLGIGLNWSSDYNSDTWAEWFYQHGIGYDRLHCKVGEELWRQNVAKENPTFLISPTTGLFLGEKSYTLPQVYDPDEPVDYSYKFFNFGFDSSLIEKRPFLFLSTDHLKNNDDLNELFNNIPLFKSIIQKTELRIPNYIPPIYAALEVTPWISEYKQVAPFVKHGTYSGGDYPSGWSEIKYSKDSIQFYRKYFIKNEKDFYEYNLNLNKKSDSKYRGTWKVTSKIHVYNYLFKVECNRLTKTIPTLKSKSRLSLKELHSIKKQYSLFDYLERESGYKELEQNP